MLENITIWGCTLRDAEICKVILIEQRELVPEIKLIHYWATYLNLIE